MGIAAPSKPIYGEGPLDDIVCGKAPTPEEELNAQIVLVNKGLRSLLLELERKNDADPEHLSATVALCKRLRGEIKRQQREHQQKLLTFDSDSQKRSLSGEDANNFFTEYEVGERTHGLINWMYNGREGDRKVDKMIIVVQAHARRRFVQTQLCRKLVRTKARKTTRYAESKTTERRRPAP